MAGDGLDDWVSADDAFARNRAYVKPGEHTFNTKLAPDEERAFLGWVEKQKVPFDPRADVTDYDMRGFWKALNGNDPKARNAVDPNDGKVHYPDFWKTPYHETFSNESQWATPDAPRWTNDDKLVTHDGKVLFDDRAQRPVPAKGLINAMPASGP